MYSNLCSGKFCTSSLWRILGFSRGDPRLLFPVHAAGILNRQESRCQLRFGLLPCRSHLIMINLKVLAMTLYLGNWWGGGRALCVRFADLNGGVLLPFWSFLYDLKQERGASETAHGAAVRNPDWRRHLAALKFARSSCASRFVWRLMLRQSHSVHEGRSPKPHGEIRRLQKHPLRCRGKRQARRLEGIINLSDMHGALLLGAIDILPVKGCHLWHHQPLF